MRTRSIAVEFDDEICRNDSDKGRDAVPRAGMTFPLNLPSRPIPKDPKHRECFCKIAGVPGDLLSHSARLEIGFDGSFTWPGDLIVTGHLYRLQFR